MVKIFLVFLKNIAFNCFNPECSFGDSSVMVEYCLGRSPIPSFFVCYMASGKGIGSQGAEYTQDSYADANTNT